jgi:hypothetical protein
MYTRINFINIFTTRMDINRQLYEALENAIKSLTNTFIASDSIFQATNEFRG